MAMSCFKTLSKHKRLEISAGIVKVLVVGGRGVGKTSFCRSFWENNEPEETYSYIGATVYPCKFEDSGTLRKVLIFDIPSDPFFFEQLVLHNVDATIIFWMYAFDDPRSADLLRDDWLPQAAATIHVDGIISALVGNKQDLREDPQVIARLAREGRNPAAFHDNEVTSFRIVHSFNIIAHDLEDVDDIFGVMFYILLDEPD